MTLISTKIEWISVDYISDRLTYKMLVEHTPYTVSNTACDIELFEAAISEIKDIDEAYIEDDTKVFMRIPVDGDTGRDYQVEFTVDEICDKLFDTIYARTQMDVSEYMETIRQLMNPGI